MELKTAHVMVGTKIIYKPRAVPLPSSGLLWVTMNQGPCFCDIFGQREE